MVDNINRNYSLWLLLHCYLLNDYQLVKKTDKQNFVQFKELKYTSFERDFFEWILQIVF